MNRWTLALLGGLLATGWTASAQAQWKWRDQSGRTQYSDLPPPQGVLEQDILSRPNGQKRPATAAASMPPDAPASGALAAASASAVGRGDPELEAKRKKAEAEQAASKKADDLKLAAARTENCARARTMMRTLDTGARLMRANEKGEREVLDDQQRAAEARRTQEVINSDCR